MALSRNCTPTSSSCIIWNGPKISCIDQCQNDTIEDVVYRLGEIVCSLAGVTPGDCDCANKIDNLTYQCLGTDNGLPLWEGGITGQEALALLIDEFMCTGDNDLITYQEVITAAKSLATPLALSSCLQYTNDGQLVTELPYDQYILLIAEYICNLYGTLVSQDVDITTLEGEVDVIQQWIANYKYPDMIRITSSCASATNPGETVDIDVAFEAFEAHYCDYISVLGSTTVWTNAMGSTCANLDTEPQMQDLTSDMEDLPNWISNPTTIAENYSNLWLAVCDLRTGLQTLLESNAILPCVLASPENLTIDSYSTITAVISWSLSSLTGIQDPIGFTVEVYEWNGITEGNLVYTSSHAGNIFTTNITSAGIIAETEYLVKVKAIYACGESSALSTIGILKENVILYQINVSETFDAGVTTSCDDGGGAVNYPYVTTSTLLELVSASTGLPITIATNITALIRYTVVHPDYGTFTTNVPITIVAGTSNVTYDYVSEQTILDGTGACSEVNKSLTCGVLISNSACEFGTGIIEC